MANAKAAATQVPWQNSSTRTRGFISPSSPIFLFTGCPQLLPSPGQYQTAQQQPGHRIFHLASKSDLAITCCTHLPFCIHLLSAQWESGWTTIPLFAQVLDVHHAGILIGRGFPILLRVSKKFSLVTCMFITSLLQKHNRDLSVPYSFPTLIKKPHCGPCFY